MGDIITGEPLRSALENANEKKEKGTALESHDAKAPSSSADSGSPTGGKREDGADAQPKTAPAAEPPKSQIKDVRDAAQGMLPLGTAPTDGPKDKGSVTSPVEAVAVAKADDLADAEDKVQYRTLPDKPIVLPNVTLCREKAYAEWPILPGVKPDSKQTETDQVRIEWLESENKLRITPKVPGDPLRFHFDYNDHKICHMEMTVNPDPWSLWGDPVQPSGDKIVFTDEDNRRIEDDHKSTIAEDFEHFKVFGASRRGRSHERTGTFRDDDLGYWADPSTGRYVFVVADGAGSARFSREGSRRAVKFITEKAAANVSVAAWEADGAEPPKTGKVGMTLASLAYKAMFDLSEFVKSENAKDPEKKWELRDFNTTLLIAAVKRDDDGSLRIVTFSIGDGAMAIFDGEKSELLCSPDGGEFSGGTYFLTTRSVWEKAAKDWLAFYNARVHTKRIDAENAKRTALFLMTDGVSDPWFETDAALSSDEKWRSFAEETLKGHGDNAAGIDLSADAKQNAERVWEWLYFKIVGNHDDRTLVAVYPQTKNVKEAK